MSKIHSLGLPRIGTGRALKWALESYWRGESDAAALLTVAAEVRRQNWAWEQEAGLDWLTVGDFAFYDQVLETTALLGAVPARFDWTGEQVDLTTLFRMARGRAPGGADVEALELTKWFDTNYHYLVPELHAGQPFRLSAARLLAELTEAQALGRPVKVKLLGPLSWLWLGKTKGEDFDRLALLEGLLPVYAELFEALAARGVALVQIDEPILSLALPASWQAAFEATYHKLQRRDLNVLLATYFAPLDQNLWLATRLPVAGLHIDVTRSGEEWLRVIDQLPEHKVLSLGVVDGRNIWRLDLAAVLPVLQAAQARLGERLWLATSCSLQHVPLDLAVETALPGGLRGRLAFARQKLDELATLKQLLASGASAPVAATPLASVPVPAVRERVAALTSADARRASSFEVRAAVQQDSLQLPPLPTTTIGSFPQTPAIRQARAAWRRGDSSDEAYRQAMEGAVRQAIREQEALGLDVLVHGEPERTDMVEYFAEQLAGYFCTQDGWVQSYGSRCIRPPIIADDVHRPVPMTVEWARFAQSLTTLPVKGMLTGPVTMLNWAFVRDDLPREQVAMQIALALRDELRDLEAAGIQIIQVDEPAFSEGLPLRPAEQPAYLEWAARSFRVATSGVSDATQVHTHMCYSEFDHILDAIVAMDADVITIETARSDMELLHAFRERGYPNAIGPGVYDIHSPVVPASETLSRRVKAALAVIPAERLWINPDCGLKTRGWPETREALQAMVAATKAARAELVV